MNKTIEIIIDKTRPADFMLLCYFGHCYVIQFANDCLGARAQDGWDWCGCILFRNRYTIVICNAHQHIAEQNILVGTYAVLICVSDR